MAVDLVKRPASRGRVSRGAVCRFLRLMGFDPRDVRGFSAGLYEIDVEVYYRTAMGEKLVFPNGEPATYTVTRGITS